MAQLTVFALIVAPAAARAGGDEGGNGDRPPPEARRSAATGAFLPFTMSARSDAQRALVHMQGGYDGARDGVVFGSVVEAQLLGPVSLRAGGSYLGPTGRLRPDVGFKLDALRQERHGLNLAVAGGYEAQGFNMTPAISARVAAARAFGGTTLFGNVAYGKATEAGEHYGDARVAVLQQVGRDLHLGVDSRYRVDLERDLDEPAGEPDWEVVAGPLASYALGRFVVSAGAGLSALKLRLSDERQVGVQGTMGLGAVF